MTAGGRPELPTPRGPVSDVVVRALRKAPGSPVPDPEVEQLDLLRDDDAQLALTCCYELSYESFAGVDDRWEWDPGLLSLRGALERSFVHCLYDEIGPPSTVPASAVVPALRDLSRAPGGPSLSGYMETFGTLDQLREFCAHRSAYQLKEADPHTWMIPRLRGRAKAAAVTIQHDEYGAGHAGSMHAELFAVTMHELGLDPTYGAYLDILPATTLATGNLVTMLGLHRRWRGAAVGHLALFEMTSVGPMSRYAAALERFGFGDAARRFYDVHVAADAWHEELAQTELVAGFVEDEPDEAGAVVFGARALSYVEARLAEALLAAWREGGTAFVGTTARALPSHDAEALERAG